MLKPNSFSKLSNNLRKALEINEKVKTRRKSKIKFSKPVLTMNGKAVFYPNTINLIQGQTGTHKSRLAQLFCSAFLKKEDCKNDLISLKSTILENPYTVVYVDTERNLGEQLPQAMQDIQVNAGYKISDDPENFLHVSLLNFNRSDRFNILTEYIEHLKASNSGPYFVVLDVSTDCIQDFNQVDQSMELIDLMNRAVNEHHIIFLCIIHENPNTVKSRGHFGTELKNKASTALQIGFVTDSHNQNTSLLNIRFLKCRNTGRHEDFKVKFDVDSGSLVRANMADIIKAKDSKKQKAGNKEVILRLRECLGNGEELSKAELVKILESKLNVKSRTINNRIKEIIDNKVEIVNKEGVSYYLYKEKGENKQVMHSLRKLEK